MNTICLQHVLPVVFSGRTDIDSQVWRQELTLRRGEICLVEAGSGRGKTSLCSYLIGHRCDYEGRILFDERSLSADEALAKVGLSERADYYPAALSGGQQQRVALMRALAQPFDFLLADEPISHLDDANAQAMGQLMLRETRAQGAGLIVTSIGKHLDLPYDNHLVL